MGALGKEFESRHASIGTVDSCRKAFMAVDEFHLA